MYFDPEKCKNGVGLEGPKIRKTSVKNEDKRNVTPIRNKSVEALLGGPGFGCISLHQQGFFFFQLYLGITH